MHIKLNKKNLNVKNVLTNDARISRKFNFLEPSTVVRYFRYLSFIIFKLNILKKKMIWKMSYFHSMCFDVVVI